VKKNYINYNLSLVDPENIELNPPTHGETVKEDTAIEIEELVEEKIEFGLLGEIAGKDAKPQEDPTDALQGLFEVTNINNLGAFGAAREYPIEPIDSDLTISTWTTEEKQIPGLPSSATYESKSKTDFKVTQDNKGKQELSPSIEPENELFIIPKLIDAYGKADKSNVSNSLIRDVESSKINIAEDSVEIGNISNEIKTKKLTDVSKDTTKDNYTEVTITEDKKIKSDNEIDFFNLSPFFKSSNLINVPYSADTMSYDQITKSLNVKGQISNLGALHVYPVNPNTEGGISSKYTIPFEFNPKISESGRAAKYEATSILSRIGDIQSYIKTEGSSVNLTTTYTVLTPDADDTSVKTGDNSGVDSWMKIFTLRNIQSIEMAYRGLVFPQTSKEAGSFYRPPVVKIVFGDTTQVNHSEEVTQTVPFNNLLTYPYKMASSTKVYHRSFVVSKVDIKKDWDNSPVILNKNNNGIVDLMTFEVTVTLNEIDPMYIGVLPSFEDYYSIVPTL